MIKRYIATILSSLLFLNSFAQGPQTLTEQESQKLMQEAMDAALKAMGKVEPRADDLPPILFPPDKAQAVEKAIDLMRGVKPSAKDHENEAANRTLDSAWEVLRASPELSKPALRKAIESALVANPTDQFFLFDAGYVLHVIEGDSALPLVIDAMKKVEASDETIDANLPQVMRLLHRLGRNPTPELLALFDRLVLKNRKPIRFFNAPHYVSLDAVLIGAFIYGVGGAQAENYLLSRLKTESDEITLSLIRTILIYVGTERSNEVMQNLLKTSRPANQRMGGMLVLLRNGGPQGREFLRKQVDRTEFKVDLGDYAERLLGEFDENPLDDKFWKDDIELAEAMKLPFKLSDEDVRTRLTTMLENDGRDRRTMAVSIVRSTIPKAELIQRLLEIRSRMFRRFDNHAVDDVRTTNKILNALRFRDH